MGSKFLLNLLDPIFVCYFLFPSFQHIFLSSHPVHDAFSSLLSCDISGYSVRNKVAQWSNLMELLVVFGSISL